MYAKFVRYVDDGHPVLSGSGDCEVVPRGHIVVEGERFEFRKYLGQSVGEIVADYNLDGEVLDWEEAPPDRKIELVHLTVSTLDGSASQQFIAPNHELYIMNDAGKTIDKMCCLIDRTPE